HKLLFTFNDTAVAYPKDKTIVDLFEEQAEKTPDNIAIVFEDRELTYRELNERSDQLAHYLTHIGVNGETLAGLYVERSILMIVSMLGILKAGAAYMPVDPEYPFDRVKYMLEDSRVKIILTDALLYPKVPLSENVKIVFADDETIYNSEYKRSLKREQVNQLACVIYTSGSSGQPKGVEIMNAGILNRMQWMWDRYPFEEHEKSAVKTSIGFVDHIWELFGALLKGVPSILFRKSDIIDIDSFIQKLSEYKITRLVLVPSLLRVILNNLEGVPDVLNCLKYWTCSGEMLTNNIIQQFYSLFPRASHLLLNIYGSTEMTADSLCHETNADFKEYNPSSIIGRPIANTTAYVLDSNLVLLPVGAVGELYIGGAGVARGYLNRQELTRERFISNPFQTNDQKAKGINGRLYRSGDLGRWLPDGNIEYLGRKDEQVKIRGYRIEPGEIEHALLSHEKIKEAVVLAKENGSGQKELVAYITSNTGQNTSELRDYLKEQLPIYMLPSYYVQLEELPLTANGKVDKKSLPDPEGPGLTSGVEYVAPRNETEAKLVKIWEEVLEREKIGVNDDFFALGGHSLKAIRLSNEYQKELSVKLSLKELFAHTSVASHAALIASSAREAFVQIEKLAPQVSYAISDGQRRLWVLSQFEGGSAAYNMPGSIYLNQDIDIENFKRAIDATIERHEILRTVFREDESGELRQWILERKDLGFVIDYRDFRKEANRKEEVEAYIAADAYRTFDLAKGPLLRAALLQVAEAEYVFYFNMHHIISDGWSMDVLAKDVFRYYEAYKTGKSPEVNALRIQYKDYSFWQLAQLNQASFKAHRTYWLDKLSGELPLLDLPGTKHRPEVKTYNGHSLATYLDKATTAKLKQYTQENGGSLFMGLLATWNVLMYRYTSQRDIIIGTPVAGREHADLEDQIGFYVNTLALRNEVNPEESFDSFYQALKAETLKSYNHQMYSFDRLVEELGLQRDTSRSAVFDIMLILQNNGGKIEGIELNQKASDQILDQGIRASKFDIEITFREAGDYLSLQIGFNTDVYEQAMVEGMIRHYKQLLHVLLETPEQRISQIDYLSEQEKHELLVTFNDTAVVYPKDKTIVDLFEEQVTKTPSNIAVVFKDTQLTYRELNEKSNQLVHYLRENYDIHPGDLVGIKQTRSEWMIVSVLGVLKAGGAYVPIDPDYPQERIGYIEQDARCKICVDETELSKFKESQERYSREPVTTTAKEGHLA
ncbi:non-ribosomal peptide synthetase, partial [Niastella populi]|uniref:non-ribosomal peptide synthetase n=1 Tax=Niastella populi TaxID=550983 RepID=UPI001054DCDC